ncbi:MAG: PQQ-binding-like beta-propeller repeat protein, partial [Endozoicomonas sp.]
VSALDQRTGASNWRQESLEYRQLTAPAVFSNYLVVGDLEGYVHLLSQVDGSLSGRFKVDSSAIKAQLLVDGDLIFIMTSDGELIALKQKATDKK